MTMSSNKLQVKLNDYDANNKWDSIYMNFKNESSKQNYQVKKANKNENKALNHYKNAIPYYHSLVVLKRSETNYMNTSLIEIQAASRAYILMRSPLRVTIGHFWQMIWEEKTKAILMLNRIMESGRSRCHQYWPSGQHNNGTDELILTKVNLKVRFVSETIFQHYTYRKFLLIDLDSNQSREVFHFHYTAWPVFGLPESPSSFLQYLFAIRQSGALDCDEYGPPVVHSSSGIGRSGTLCFVDSCLVLIEKYGRVDGVNVIDILLDMRKYRMGLIQTAEQLRFSYQAILEWSKSHMLCHENTSSTAIVNGECHNEESSRSSKIHHSLGMDNDDTSSFAIDFAREISEMIRKPMEEIANCWFQIGIPHVKRAERRAEMMSLFEKVLKNSRETEHENLDELILYRDKKLKELNEILNDLTLPHFVLNEDDLTLIQAIKLLNIKCFELTRVKKERLKQLAELKIKRDKLCHMLGVQAKEITMQTAIPSEEELMMLQSYVSDLSRDRSKRFSKLQPLRKVIKSLFFVDLEEEASGKLERQIMFDDEAEQLILSHENFKRLQCLHAELEEEYCRNNERRKELERKLIAFWNRLDIEHAERDLFICGNARCQPSVIKFLEIEVSKYEEMKRQNIELFVLKVRSELLLWYQKCCSSDHEREAFIEYFECDVFTEELLQLHERELSRLQQFYQENELIFGKLDKWKNYWLRYHKLEQKASDPKRLFNNRGGALLAEEKERNQLQRGLLKLEKELRNMSKQWSDMSERRFMVYGMELEKYFELQWKVYHQTKENEKKERQRAKQMGMETGMKATPAKVDSAVALRKTPFKRQLEQAEQALLNGSGGKMRRMDTPLTPARIQNERNSARKGTVTKRPVSRIPVPKSMGRNFNA